MTEPHDFTATIHNKDRRKNWLTIYDTDTVPIKSPIPTRTNLPGHPNTLIYELDLDAITANQRQRLVAHTAKRFGYDPAYVEAELDKEGMPILTSDVTVTTRKLELFL